MPGCDDFAVFQVHKTNFASVCSTSRERANQMSVIEARHTLPVFATRVHGPCGWGVSPV